MGEDDEAWIRKDRTGRKKVALPVEKLEAVS
jgi:hypothetical protein